MKICHLATSFVFAITGTFQMNQAIAGDRDKRDYRIESMGVDWNVCKPESHPECQRFNALERRYRSEQRDQEAAREERRLRDLDNRSRDRNSF